MSAFAHKRLHFAITFDLPVATLPSHDVLGPAAGVWSASLSWFTALLRQMEQTEHTCSLHMTMSYVCIPGIHNAVFL